MITDRMRINHADDETLPDYGSLYLVRYDEKSRVNDYGGSAADAEKLELITNAAPGSTCLFSNGDIYRLELDGWTKFGEEDEETAASSASPASLNLTPMSINRNDLMNDTEEMPEELTVEPITIDGEMI